MKSNRYLSVVGAVCLFASGDCFADTIYVATALDNTIHQFTTNGVDTVFALDTLANPFGLAFDKSGNLFVANNGNNTIEKITTNGIATIFASDPGDYSILSNPTGLAFDREGNLYVANNSGNFIEKFTTNGVASTFASDPSAIFLNGPEGIAFDTNGYLYVANDDSFIEKFSTNGTDLGRFDNGMNLDRPVGLAFDAGGNLYAANSQGVGYASIVKFDADGNGTVFTTSHLDYPQYLAFDTNGNLYVANSGASNTIVKFSPAAVPTVFAGTGLTSPVGLAFDRDGNLFASNYGQFIEKFDSEANGTVFISGSIVNPQAMTLDRSGNLYLANGSPFVGHIMKFDTNGIASVFGPNAFAAGLATDSADNIYAANYYFNTITKYAPDGSSATFANAGLSNPEGLVLDSSGNIFVVNGSGNSPQNGNAIEKFTPLGAGSIFVTNQYGINDAFGPGLAIDSSNNLYTLNVYGGSIIVKITPDGVFSNFATNDGPSFDVSNVQGMDFDSAGNLYVVNYYNGSVMKFDPAGSGTIFATNLDYPTAIVIKRSSIRPSIPALVITRAGNSAVISWPLAATGYNLYSTTNLANPSWQAVSGSLVTNGSNLVFTNLLNGSVRFFRLSNP